MQLSLTSENYRGANDKLSSSTSSSTTSLLQSQTDDSRIHWVFFGLILTFLISLVILCLWWWRRGVLIWGSRGRDYEAGDDDPLLSEAQPEGENPGAAAAHNQKAPPRWLRWSRRLFYRNHGSPEDRIDAATTTFLPGAGQGTVVDVVEDPFQGGQSQDVSGHSPIEGGPAHTTAVLLHSNNMENTPQPREVDPEKGSLSATPSRRSQAALPFPLPRPPSTPQPPEVAALADEKGSLHPTPVGKPSQGNGAAPPHKEINRNAAVNSQERFNRNGARSRPRCQQHYVEPWQPVACVAPSACTAAIPESMDFSNEQSSTPPSLQVGPDLNDMENSYFEEGNYLADELDMTDDASPDYSSQLAGNIPNRNSYYVVSEL